MTRYGCGALAWLLAFTNAVAWAQTDSEAVEEAGEGSSDSADEIDGADDDFLDPDEAWADDLPADGTAEVLPGTYVPPEPTGTFDHGHWTDVLSRHVNDDGRIDYGAWLDDPAALADLDAYLAELSTADPATLSHRERVAFWINAYNACAVRAALDSYPLDSPRTVADFFDAPRCAGPGNLSLNDIENVQLGLFSPDPRFHFALCPAALGAPPLRREAYSGAGLEEELAEQTTRFIRATTRVIPNLMEVELSRLFEWFANDFERFGGVRTFVAAHLDPQPAELLRAAATLLVYTELDWRLNDVE